MINTRPLEVIDFTQGITDYFIDGRPSQGEEMDNFFINPNRKIVTRWGSEVAVPSQIPLGLFRVHGLAFLEDTLLAFAHRRLYFDDGGTWSELLGPDTVSPPFAAGDANLIVNHTEWQNHLFLASDTFNSIQKVYKDNLGVLQLRNAGLPEMPAGVSITPPPGAGFNYLYSFNLKYTYTVGTVTYLDRGPVYVHPTQITGGEIGPNTAIVNLPTVLTSPENWDEANIEIEIYRTLNAGDVYYLVDTVSLGTAIYNDNNTDTIIQDNETIYTTGGVTSNGTPPKSKFVHVVNDIGYYGYVEDGSSDGKFTIRQSIPGDPDSVPASYFTETEQEIKAVSSIYDRPMVFCENYIYRIDNTITNVGTGDMDLRRIDDRAGCAGPNSVVRTHKGVFWAGDVGFYWSDGLKVLKISDNINETYKSFVFNQERRGRIYGTYEPSNDRVIWAVSKEDGANEPDIAIILDLKWEDNIRRGEGAFTTMSNGEYFRPTAMAVNNNMIYRGDTRGYVLRHDQQLFTDPKIDIATAVADWEKLAIVYSYKSTFLDFGTKFVRKFVSRILVSAANLTNLSLGITSSNDNNRVVGELKPIRYKDNITWGESLPLWGDSTARWNYQGIIEEWRRFPAGGLRCQYKQIQLTNADAEIVTSDLLGQGTVDDTAKTVTLSGSAQWISDIVDYKILFENDDYTREFLITARTATTITFEDTSNFSPVSGDYDFIIKGIPKGEVLELNGYIIHWAHLSKTHTPFTASSLGSGQ